MGEMERALVLIAIRRLQKKKRINDTCSVHVHMFQNHSNYTTTQHTHNRVSNLKKPSLYESLLLSVFFFLRSLSYVILVLFNEYIVCTAPHLTWIIRYTEINCIEPKTQLILFVLATGFRVPFP